MMLTFRPSFLIFALLLVHKSLQHLPSASELCAAACSSALDEVVFNTTVETDDYYTGYCEDTLRFSSIFFCIRIHCSQSQIESAVNYAVEDCHTEVHVDTPSYQSVIAGYSDEALSAIPIISMKEPSKEIVNVTVLPSEEGYLLAMRTWVSFSLFLLLTFFSFLFFLSPPSSSQNQNQKSYHIITSNSLPPPKLFSTYCLSWSIADPFFKINWIETIHQRRKRALYCLVSKGRTPIRPSLIPFKHKDFFFCKIPFPPHPRLKLFKILVGSRTVSGPLFFWLGSQTDCSHT